MSAERRTPFFEMQALLGSLFLNIFAQTEIKIPIGMFADNIRGHLLGDKEARVQHHYDADQNTLYVKTGTVATANIGYEEVTIIDNRKIGTTFNQIRVGVGEKLTLPNKVEVSNIRD